MMMGIIPQIAQNLGIRRELLLRRRSEQRRDGGRPLALALDQCNNFQQPLVQPATFCSSFVLLQFRCDPDISLHRRSAIGPIAL